MDPVRASLSPPTRGFLSSALIFHKRRNNASTFSRHGGQPMFLFLRMEYWETCSY